MYIHFLIVWKILCLCEKNADLKRKYIAFYKYLSIIINIFMYGLILKEIQK